MKLLIAIDGSENALRALRYVIAHPDFFGASPELILVTAHLPLPSTRAKAVLGSDVLENYYKDESNETLAPARAILGETSCRVTEQLVVGQPAEQIVATAQKFGCDFIVLGTQGRSALGNLLMGSVAMRVISASPVPVLSIK